MENSVYDWSTFTKRVTIKSDLASIFSAWTTRAGMESWFLSKAEFLDGNNRVRADEEEVESGDSYSWEWLAANDVVEGEVLDFEREKSFSFSFLECRVSVSFYIEAGESIVEVIQSEIPTDDVSKINRHLDCIEGWTFYLTNLKSVLEGGLDLRNRNEGIGELVNT